MSDYRHQVLDAEDAYLPSPPEATSRPPGIAAGGIMAIAGRFSQPRESGKLALMQSMTQVPFTAPIVISASAGSVGSYNGNGPMSGYYWSLRRVQVQGFSAGSLICYRNGELSGNTGGVAQGIQSGSLIGTPEVMFPVPSAGTFTFGAGEQLLNPCDWMTFVATGITLATGYGVVLLQGTADCFPSYLLGDYLL